MRSQQLDTPQRRVCTDKWQQLTIAGVLLAKRRAAERPVGGPCGPASAAAALASGKVHCRHLPQVDAPVVLCIHQQPFVPGGKAQAAVRQGKLGRGCGEAVAQRETVLAFRMGPSNGRQGLPASVLLQSRAQLSCDDGPWPNSPAGLDNTPLQPLPPEAGLAVALHTHQQLPAARLPHKNGMERIRGGGQEGG